MKVNIDETPEVSRVRVLTLHVYLLSMLMMEYLDELSDLPVWAMNIKNSGKAFNKSLGHKVIEQQISQIHDRSPEDFQYMLRMFENVTKLLSSYDPEELEDAEMILEQFKNNKEGFMKHFNFVKDENKERAES